MADIQRESKIFAKFQTYRRHLNSGDCSATCKEEIEFISIIPQYTRFYDLKLISDVLMCWLTKLVANVSFIAGDSNPSR